MLVIVRGPMRISVQHVIKRGNMYLYRRRYPAPLAEHFRQSYKVVSLKTSNPDEAAKRAVRQAAEDDADWAALERVGSKPEAAEASDLARAARWRLRSLGIEPGQYGPKELSREERERADREEAPYDALADYLDSKHGAARDAVWAETHEPSPWSNHLDAGDLELIRLSRDATTPCFLRDALAYYLREHPRGSQKKFSDDVTRSVGHVLSIIGNRPLGSYKRADAEKVRDALLTKVKTRTVRRHLSDIGAVFAKGINGFDLQIVRHAFQDVEIIGEGADATNKQSFTHSDLVVVAQAVRAANDPLRLLAGLLVNTGARVSEMVGLKIEDVRLQDAIPHVHIRPHPEAFHTLKTPGSKRAVPLVGVSLWSAQRLIERAEGSSSPWLFPQYVGTNRAGAFGIKSNSADVALNKWLKRQVDTHRTSHCFRHALRDRLLDSGAPTHVQNEVGGWGSKTIGERYGSGHTLAHLLKYLEPIAI